MRHPGELGPEPDGDHRAHEVLALAADVEQPGAERERDGQAHEDQRRRGDQGLLQVQCRESAVGAGGPREQPVQAGAVEDRLVGRDRVLARYQHDEPAGDERQQRREQRHDDAAAAHVAGEARGGRRERFGFGPSSARELLLDSGRSLTPPAPAAGHQETELLLGRVGRHLADDPRPRRSRGCGRPASAPPRTPARPAGCRGRRRARRSAGDGRTRSRRRRARASAGGRSAAWGSRRSRARCRPSAGCRPTARTASVSVAAAHVVLLQQPASARGHAAHLQPPATAQLGRAVLAQREVLGKREGQHQPAPVTVLGDVARRRRRSRAHAAPADLAAADVDAPGLRLGRPAIASTSSCWPLPSTPASATISPARTSSDAAHRLQPAVVAHVQVLDARASARPACAASLSTRRSTSRPTIIRARLSSVAPSFGHRVDPLAAPQHRDAVGDLEHLVELVADEDDRVPPSRSARSTLEQLRASCAVSTAVGSSSTRIFAPRYSARRISTRCCIPTLMSSTRASGSTASP